MGTSCASGKWCNNGLCISNPLAPVGSCIIADDEEYCHEFTQKYGFRNTCLNFKSTRCCKICGGVFIERLVNHTINDWISKSTLKNVVSFSNEKIIICNNKYKWCEITIPSFLKNISDFCKNLYLVNNEIVQVVCRKSCGLC
jgi:hypothetical protein